ncbi:MAG: helix-turn-helix domain-containing protein [Neptuniibacter sp.]
MTLGARLKNLRVDKGASLQTVADAVGASKPHIWELEKGSSKNPSLDLVTKLANYYSVSVDFLIGVEGADEASPEIKAFARELASKGLSSADIEVLRAAADALSKKKDD